MVPPTDASRKAGQGEASTSKAPPGVQWYRNDRVPERYLELVRPHIEVRIGTLSLAGHMEVQSSLTALVQAGRYPEYRRKVYTILWNTAVF